MRFVGLWAGEQRVYLPCSSTSLSTQINERLAAVAAEAERAHEHEEREEEKTAALSKLVQRF
jgi:hypothetical protein